MLKNVANQKVLIFAKDGYSAGVIEDAENITAYISKDGDTSVQSDDIHPTEVDAVNMPGVYAFDITQEESDCNDFMMFPKSSTDGVYIDLIKLTTEVISVHASPSSIFGF
jgi:hypothetical protein